MTEIEWRPISSWPGYEVSSDGQVRLTIKRRTRGPRIIKGSRNRQYLLVQTTFDGRKVWISIHSAVCEAFHGPAPSPSHEVRHLDGNPGNNRAENLKWGTAKENAADRRQHGRDRLGSDHHAAKIDEHDVIAILCLARRGFTGEEIGRLFGLDRNNVNKIIARKLWAHVSVHDELATAAKNRGGDYAAQTWGKKRPGAIHLFGETARERVANGGPGWTP